MIFSKEHFTMVRVVLFLFLTIAFCDLNSQPLIFDSNTLLRIDIVADLKSLFRDVNPEIASYHKGFITYIDDAGDVVRINVKLKTRGIFRRSKENCNLPPISIKFNDDNLSATIFKDINKLKLVNSCNRKRAIFQQYLIKEYLSYKMYNKLTDYSFRVRLLQISYIDINNSFPPFESIGFFIEDMESLNKRTNTNSVKTLGIVQEAVDRRKMDITAVFQYMIGNTDWSVPKLHNIKLVLDSGVLIPVAVPYDFDFCGFVNPPYTKPPDIIPIDHVTTRYYRGFCRTNDEFRPIIQLFEERKDSIFSVIISDTILNKKHRTEALKYIDDFYQIIIDPKLFRKEFIDNCRND